MQFSVWPVEVRRRSTLFMAACESVGRDPSTMHRSAQAMVFYTPTAAAREALEPHVVADRPSFRPLRRIFAQALNPCS